MLAGDVLGRTGQETLPTGCLAPYSLRRTGQETRPTGAGEDDLLAGGRSGVR